MFKTLVTSITSLVAVVVLLQPMPIFAAEHEHAEAKKEAADAMANGTKGESVGTVLSNEKGKVILKTKDGNLLFMPHWRGGMPKDGGGLEKEMVEKLGKFKAGDQVKISWVWEERRRIEHIERVSGKD